MGKATPRSKLSISLDSPYTATKWPEVFHDDHNLILDLLCSLLEPVGRHRDQYKPPSQGKRSKKRKRHEAQVSASTSQPCPAAPDVSNHVTVGFNSTTRHLESLSSLSRPPAIEPLATKPYPLRIPKAPPKDSIQLAPPVRTPLAAVFVPKSAQRDLIHGHLPLLLRTASMGSPKSPAARLVPLSKSSEARLAAALRVPRVGVLGVMEDAPGARALLEVVRERIQPVEVPWLEEARAAEFLPPKYVVYDPSLKVA